MTSTIRHALSTLAHQNVAAGSLTVTFLARTPTYTTQAASKDLSVTAPSAGYIVILGNLLPESFSGNLQTQTASAPTLANVGSFTKYESEGVIGGQTPHHSVAIHVATISAGGTGNLRIATADANGSIINFSVYHVANSSGVGASGTFNSDGSLGLKTCTLGASPAASSVIFGLAQQPSNNTLSNTALTPTGTQQVQTYINNPAWLTNYVFEEQTVTGSTSTSAIGVTMTVLNYNTRLVAVEMKV